MVLLVFEASHPIPIGVRGLLRLLLLWPSKNELLPHRLLGSQSAMLVGIVPGAEVDAQGLAQKHPCCPAQHSPLAYVYPLVP